MRWLISGCGGCAVVGGFAGCLCACFGSLFVFGGLGASVALSVPPSPYIKRRFRTCPSQQYLPSLSNGLGTPSVGFCIESLIEHIGNQL
jgi:hypothetical protein